MPSPHVHGENDSCVEIDHRWCLKPKRKRARATDDAIVEKRRRLGCRNARIGRNLHRRRRVSAAPVAAGAKRIRYFSRFTVTHAPSSSSTRRRQWPLGDL